MPVETWRTRGSEAVVSVTPPTLELSMATWSRPGMPGLNGSTVWAWRGAYSVKSAPGPGRSSCGPEKSIVSGARDRVADAVLDVAAEEGAVVERELGDRVDEGAVGAEHRAVGEVDEVAAAAVDAVLTLNQ
jgi:hypothetical protein